MHVLRTPTRSAVRDRSGRNLTIPNRTEAFSDGVFAIAITLLVLGLRVPTTNGSLVDALVGAWPSYAAYVVSFLTIGIIWINHHALFDRLMRLDRSLLFLNLLFLMTVSLLPFPTAILSEYLQRQQGNTAAMIYSMNMGLMGATFGLMWLYVLRHDHLLAGGAGQHFAGFLLRFSAGAPIYVLAALVGLVDARITLLICGVLAVYYVLLSTPGEIRHYWSERPSQPDR